jgi:hypothetical protein
MKNKIIIIVVLLSISGMLTMPGCKKESSTPPVVYYAWTQPVIVSPASGSFVDVTGTTIDLVWQSTNADGDAQNWDVYLGTSKLTPALVQSGLTAQKYTATVDLGVKYYWKVVGIDKNGKQTATPIQNFETVDQNAALNMNMSWTTDISSVIDGLTIAPDAAVKLRLLILNADTLTPAVPIINTGTFETFGAFNTLADGTYFIATDIASTVNAGDFNKPFDISIDLGFSQRGIYSLTLPFPNIMTNQFNCPLYKTVLAKVTKTGNVFTADKSVRYITPPVLTWKGTDATYPSQVTTSASCTSTTMTGLGFQWFIDFWGEIIVTGGTCNYTVSGSTITIPLQPYCTTTYLGAAQPAYSIQGTGTIDNSGAYPLYTIHYDFFQNGLSIATISMDYGWPTPYFEAIITTNPAKGEGKFIMQIDKAKR